MLLDKALTRFMNGWIVLVMVLNLIAIASLWAGLLKVQSTHSPLNILTTSRRPLRSPPPSAPISGGSIVPDAEVQHYTGGVAGRRVKDVAELRLCCPGVLDAQKEEMPPQQRLASNVYPP